jgi:hypothetical protein
MIDSAPASIVQELLINLSHNWLNARAVNTRGSSIEAPPLTVPKDFRQGRQRRTLSPLHYGGADSSLWRKADSRVSVGTLNGFHDVVVSFSELHPSGDSDPLAFFQVFVVRKEMCDLFVQNGRQVVEAANVDIIRI